MNFNCFSPFMLVLSGNIDVKTSGGTTWGVANGTIFWNNDYDNPQFIIFEDDVYRWYDIETEAFGAVVDGLPSGFVEYTMD